MFKYTFKVSDAVYQVDIKVNEYGAILEVKKDDKTWYKDIFDLYSVNGSLNSYITSVIQRQEQALKG